MTAPTFTTRPATEQLHHYAGRHCVSERTVHKLMRLAGIYGLPGPIRTKRLRGVVTADDLVNRKFARPAQTSSG